MMRSGRQRLALAGTAAVLQAVAVTSGLWWTADFGISETRVGLRKASQCVSDLCRSIDVDIGTAATCLYYAGLLAAIALVAAIVLDRVHQDDRGWLPAGVLSVVLLPLIVLAYFAFDGRTVLSPGWAIPVCMAGAVAGGVAGLRKSWAMELGGDREETVLVPGEPLPTARAGARGSFPRAPVDDNTLGGNAPRSGRPATPAPPESQTAGHTHARHRMDYGREVAAANAIPKKNFRRPKQAVRTLGDVGPAAVDASRSTLRFVAKTVQLFSKGFKVQPERGEPFQLTYQQIVRVVARQLPPDRPFEKMVFIDIVPASGSPVRILPSTRVDYASLPGGAAPSSRANFIKLCNFLVERGPSTQIEEASRDFVTGGGAPPALQSVGQLAKYDAEYG